ncbi:uncharacterized protein LOC126775308 isoform X2 [Nymphalis io]|uniref:uncharacterized protein LOC126775308 isoform X2 n=1 Tax=Inachis io TaxID=171585 RepID=UPI0021686387|nr:uncharacterized protein LOC126775308 isoform X2 [Nymphalis io]
MAPPPEYDKEPKAPDKSVTTVSNDDSKVLYNIIKDQSTNSDNKITTAGANSEGENKHVETLDDGQLRALLDEAITYKCPKDREGKSSLFKELLEEVEQDEQACEAAARGLGAGRGGRRGRGHREHHSSLQDLVAAMAGEAAPRRGRTHAHAHAHTAPPAASVSARALHGGSLPSGVDTSFLLSEEAGGIGCGPTRGGYLATVRCVNPPPLAERRVSAGDANPPEQAQALQAQDDTARRSKPSFPMTYTARATLEIGSGSVCSGRAVTTTTASNQVRTPSLSAQRNHDAQTKLTNALRIGTAPKGGGVSASVAGEPRGPGQRPQARSERRDSKMSTTQTANGRGFQGNESLWMNSVNNWYSSLDKYYNLTVAAVASRTEFVTNKQVVANDSNIYLKNETEQGNKQTQQTFLDRANFSSRFNEIDRFNKRNMRNIEDKKKYSFNLYETPNETDIKNGFKNDHKVFSDIDSDNSLRKKYRERVGHNLVAPNTSIINPKNFRNMTIGEPSCSVSVKKSYDTCYEIEEKSPSNKNYTQDFTLNKNYKEINSSDEMQINSKKEFEMQDITSKPTEKTSETINDKELVDNSSAVQSDTFSKFVDQQRKFIKNLEINQTEDRQTDSSNNVVNEKNDTDTISINKSLHIDINPETNCLKPNANTENLSENLVDFQSVSQKDIATQLEKVKDKTTSLDQVLLTDLPKSSYVFLTLPKSFDLAAFNENYKNINITEIECNNDNITNVSDEIKNVKNKNNIKRHKEINENSSNKANLNSDITEKSEYLKKKLSPYKDFEVDSAIPFSCITTPEVVASCNTTSSASQPTTAIDPKPLQLDSSYRAVASLTGDAEAGPAPAAPAPAAPRAAPALQPRSVISSSFNGLPLSRPGYGSASDDYKKSLDENGNAVQGFSSPLSGSSQLKKPRRKKSSKNETVIKSHQIDGYQGNKDLNEVLRFIESNAEGARGPKLGRVKHKDDSDDKGGKKRSTERRKDKESKMKRATSMEELSRTKLEDLTDKPALRTAKPRGSAAPAKPERRSWGDDARALLYRAPTSADPEPPTLELTEFQTVTKKRKTRRRTDDSERETDAAQRRTRLPSAEARARPSDPASAAPSDRSNDSNDDMDSVHSLPALAPAAPAPPPPPPHASYADIARTRHNIPDLIESCNFYAEGEAEPRLDPGSVPAAGAVTPGGAPAAEAEQYPVLAVRRAREKAPPAAVRAPRKERAETLPAAEPPAPAPDVVADRRPPVILLDSAARPGDMDGVTFGFDINEQLLGGSSRRGARVDLLRDAPEHARAGGALSVPVRACAALSVPVPVRACVALRYVPPDLPPNAAQLLQIVDYVGAAWEDVVRCGGGKVRYFSE